MPPIKRLNLSLALLASGFLVACGGGGGGGGGGTVTPTIVSSADPCVALGTGLGAVTPSTTNTVLISGIANSEVLVNQLSSNGALNYATPVIKPMRGITLEAYRGSTVLASTTTAANGAFSLAVPENAGCVALRAKASLQNTGSASWNVQVKDNTNGNALYALVSDAFTVSTAAINKNMTAGSGWASDASVTGVRASAAFAILDTMYTAIQTVVSVAPSTVFPALTVYWSENNTSSTGDRTLGQIGSSSYLNSSGVHSIYVLGKVGVDTDEFDDSVVAHEWGHYAQSAFSRDDSQGGEHSFGDKLDMRVAFSEGWGNAWSGIATGRTKYADAYWLGSSTVGFVIALDVMPSVGDRGWFSESSVLYSMYTLNSQVGFTPIWQALQSMKSTTALTSIYSFAANLPASASSAMSALLSGQSITGTDAFGTGETGNADLAVTLPIYKTITVGAAATTVCVSGVNGTYNKAGNWLAFRFTPSAAGTRTFTVSSTTAGADPDFYVYQGGANVLTAINPPASSETASITMTATQAVLIVTDDQLVDAGASCLSVRVQ